MVSVFRVGCPLHPMEHSEHREHTQHSRAQRAQPLTYNYMFLNDFFWLSCNVHYISLVRGVMFRVASWLFTLMALPFGGGSVSA